MTSFAISTRRGGPVEALLWFKGGWRDICGEVSTGFEGAEGDSAGLAIAFLAVLVSCAVVLLEPTIPLRKLGSLLLDFVLFDEPVNVLLNRWKALTDLVLFRCGMFSTGFEASSSEGSSSGNGRNANASAIDRLL